VNGATPALFAALALTGLAGSLHCAGMCGPILIGLSRRLPRDGSFALDSVAYHLGRLWTYALLGAVSGAVGARVGAGWGARNGLALALGAAVVLVGLALLRRRASRLENRIAAAFSALLRGVTTTTGIAGRRGFVARVLVGAVMGLTPCGMVWAALVPATALGHPLLSALGMLCFGLGTLPVMSSIVLLDRVLSGRLRRHGRAIAAVALIVAGIWIFGRALPGGGADAHTGHAAHHALSN